jgi:hypothetical protein
MPEKFDDIDWSLTTWEGSRREQIRRWSELTMDEILAAQEEMADFAQATTGPAESKGRPPRSCHEKTGESENFVVPGRIWLCRIRACKVKLLES